jgi:segregation and condensation protein A
MDEIDLEAATGFLVVAASLLELKSTRLLPSGRVDADDADALDERDRLLARLIECSTYRSAGEWIALRLENGARFHARTATLEPALAQLLPDVLEAVAVTDVARAAARALAPAPEPVVDIAHLAPISVSVRDAIVSVARSVKVAQATTFRELCASARQRIEVVVRFLALLELFKAGAVELDQSERFGDIGARWTGEVATADVLRDSDEYASVGEAG